MISGIPPWHLCFSFQSTAAQGHDLIGAESQEAATQSNLPTAEGVSAEKWLSIPPQPKGGGRCGTAY